MSIDMEPPIETEKDIIEQVNIFIKNYKNHNYIFKGRQLYFPAGTAFHSLFLNSPNKEYNILAEIASEKNAFERIRGGSYSIEFERVFI